MSEESEGSFPKAVLFVLANEFCERFTFYGLRTVLSIYITEELHFEEKDAMVIYHIFAMLVYSLPLVGAIIADSWLGKFKTVIYLSLVYTVGNVLLAVSAVRPLHLPQRTFSIIGLMLVAVGAGGRKPCLAAFGGDQFELPRQSKDLDTFFHLLYFAVNAGGLISALATPILRKQVSCFDEHSCYPLSFGVPGVLIILSIILLLIGKSMYKMKNPEGNVLVKVSHCICSAIKIKCKSRGERRGHWLDYAVENHGEKIVNEVKIVLRILYLYLPIPIFFALFEQIATAWTFQARRMDGNVGELFTILPDQMQVTNPLLALAFIPIFNYIIYPCLSKVNILVKPLQRIVVGGMLAGISFTVAAFVSLAIESTLPVLPNSEEGQIRIFNVLPCDITVTAEKLNQGKGIYIPKLSFYADIHLAVHRNATYSYSMTGPCSSSRGEFMLYERKSTAYFFNENGKSAVYAEDNVEKNPNSHPNVRTVVNLNGKFTRDINIEYLTKKGRLYRKISSADASLYSIMSDYYTVKFGTKFSYKCKFALGGVYTVAAVAEAEDDFTVEQLVVTSPNNINIFWLIPQYVILTAGEIMFSVTGIEFSYSQAPQSMKSVMQAMWLLTYAFGQVIVIVIESVKIFDKPSTTSFLYGAVMCADMLIFICLAARYQYVELKTE